MSESVTDKNINPERQEKTSEENAVISSTKGADNAMDDSQSFQLDFEESQLNESAIKENQVSSTMVDAADEKPAEEARETNKNVVDVDKQNEDKRNEDKVIVEAEMTIGDDESENDLSKNEDIEDDIVQGTPPLEEKISPLKRQLLDNVAAIKRKAEDDSDDQVRKIQRRLSTEEGLSTVRKKLTNDEDDHESGELDKKKSDEIIPDSQEVEGKNEPDEAKSSVSLAESLTKKSEEIESRKDVDTTEKNLERKTEVDGPNEKNGKSKDTNAPEEMPKTPTKKGEKLTSCAMKISPADEKMETEDMEKVEKPSSVIELPEIAVGSKTSRMSIEVIFDKSKQPPSKPRELVEIDEDGEKIVLDSSQENSLTVETSYKISEGKTSSENYKSFPIPEGAEKTTETQLTNGTDDLKKSNADSLMNLAKQKLPEVLNLISDSEGDSFVNEETKPKGKPLQLQERELNILLKLKCQFHVDETNREFSSKEIISVFCEPFSDLHFSRRVNSDNSGLADISGEKGVDSNSPESVNSNKQPYRLPKNNRQSLMSTVSSSSSSSAGSAKLDLKDNIHFSLPRGFAKHAKKPEDNVDELAEKMRKEWKNSSELTSCVLQFVNHELLNPELSNGTDQTEDTSPRNIRSSTPEVSKNPIGSATPKSTKKGRVVKRTRGQNSRSSRTNGIAKVSPNALASLQEAKKEIESLDNTLPSSELSTPSRSSARGLSILRNQTPVYDPSDALIGKECFAKWSDNDYYPGKVVSRSKGKFKVVFLDGKFKHLIEDFVVPMPKTLPEGSSVYATGDDDEFGSPGIITHVETKNNQVFYTVDTDDSKTLKIQIKDISMTSDQIQSLRETIKNIESPVSTPRMEKVSLDNLVDGSRRGKSTSNLSTPKSVKGKSLRGSNAKTSHDVEPSISGVGKADDYPDNDGKTSDSSFSMADDVNIDGVQPEISDMPKGLATKGPQNRMKGKAKSRRKEDQEFIALVGPIPETNTNLFKGMSFIVSCVPVESIERFQDTAKPIDSENSEPETDNENDWGSLPLLRERLTEQLTAGGGKVYEKFDDIPPENYKDTKLITNVPNSTANSLLCLSAGIKFYNHRWVIRCCQENKLVSASSEELPAGWSLEKKSYIDFFNRPNNLPFAHAIVVIPKIPLNEQFIEFWSKVVRNAGGAVRVIESAEESFIEGTVVLTNSRCPSWVQENADSWKIPLVSTFWIMQCLVEGRVLPYDTQPAYKHNYMRK